MKKYLTFLLAAIVLSISAASFSSSTGIKCPASELLQTTSQEVTITVTIVKIDLTTKTVVLKDPAGKLYTFVLDAQSTIDLSKYKVGDKVTATVKNLVTTDNVTRARITKTQLIKLQ
jgi:hypothetical protein